MTIKFTYTNHKNETEVRTVKPLFLVYYENPAMVSEHLEHYQHGWFLVAHDLERDDDRSFYLGQDVERHLVIIPGEGIPLEIGDLATINETVKTLEGRVSQLGTAANFAVWLTTRPRVIEVGGPVAVYGMFDALAEYEKTELGMEPTILPNSQTITRIANMYLHFGLVDLETLSPEGKNNLVTHIRALAGFADPATNKKMFQTAKRTDAPKRAG